MLKLELLAHFFDSAIVNFCDVVIGDWPIVGGWMLTLTSQETLPTIVLTVNEIVGRELLLTYLGFHPSPSYGAR